MSKDGQVYIASAIYRAFKYYKQEIERQDNKARQVVKEYYTEPENTGLPDLCFRVQFTTARTRKTFDVKKFRDMPDIREYRQDGLYKYTTGNFRTYDEALKHQKSIRKSKKYKDAFVVCFLNGERISLDKALEMTKK
jgi:N-acetylmuramoyl-L-alanine amidase